jgi:hypothetical protein
LLSIVLALATGAGWLIWAGGGLRGPAGGQVYWAAMLTLVAGVFFLRQLRG